MKQPKVQIHFTHQSRRAHPCPTCKARLSMATNADPEDSTGPVPGAAVLCIWCGHAAVFTPDMMLRLMRLEELRVACNEATFRQAYLIMLRKRRAWRSAHGGPSDGGEA
jgi:hypothetical protein